MAGAGFRTVGKGGMGLMTHREAVRRPMIDRRLRKNEAVATGFGEIRTRSASILTITGQNGNAALRSPQTWILAFGEPQRYFSAGFLPSDTRRRGVGVHLAKQ